MCVTSPCRVRPCRGATAPASIRHDGRRGRGRRSGADCGGGKSRDRRRKTIDAGSIHATARLCRSGADIHRARPPRWRTAGHRLRWMLTVGLGCNHIRARQPLKHDEIRLSWSGSRKSFTSPRRGEVDRIRRQTDSIKNHHALANCTVRAAAIIADGITLTPRQSGWYFHLQKLDDLAAGRAFENLATEP